MKRVGEGKDAAAMAQFLLSEDSSWITGQIIGVDGGSLNYHNIFLFFRISVIMFINKLGRE